MVNIIGRSIPVQPQQSGVGSLFETLAAPFMDMNTGEVKRSAAALNNAKAADAQRAYDAGGVIAQLARENRLNTPEALAQAILAGKTSTDLGGFQHSSTLMGGAPLAGDAVARTALMAGKAYSTTPMAAAQELAAAQERQRMQEATRLTIQARTPYEGVGPDGNFVTTTVGTATAPNSGYRPAVSTDQVRAGEVQRILPNVDPQRREDFALGAPAQRTPRTYVANGQSFVTYDGVNNAQTGQPLPQGGYMANTQGSADETGTGGNSTKRGVVERRIGTQTALAGIDNLDKLLADPNAGAAVGFLGAGATMFNNVRAQTEAAVRQFAPGGIAAEVSDPAVAQSLDGAMNRLIGNPNFNSRAQQLGIQATVLRSQIQDLAYTLAKAYDPAGRMSNQDVERAAEIIGGAIMDPVAGRAVLQATRNQIVERNAIAEREYERMFGIAPVQPQGAPAAAAQPGAAPAQPAAPAAPAAEVTATGPNGEKLVLRNGQWVPK
jgi:hypothetical protein